MIVWSFTYLLLFSLVFFFFVPFIRVQSSPAFLSRFFGVVDVLPILSMPLSLFLMWFSYSRAYYKVTRFCWITPLFLFALALVLHIVLEPSHARK